MNIDLADRLLARVLDFETDKLSRYRPQIEILSKVKYDEYQQFFPGMRFTESLAMWLDQFVEKKYRNDLFNFVMKKLIFISNKEMNELVAQVYPDVLRPNLINIVAKRLKISPHKVKHIVETKEYKINLRKTLFLGLSDGARTDVIRRFNPFISHEQLLPFYLIPENKITDLKEKLIKELKEIDSDISEADNDKFLNLVLLDDFTASGTSYFKFNQEKEFEGKVSKILDKLKISSEFANLFDINQLNIVLIIYVASTHAIEAINQAIIEWEEKHKKSYQSLNFQTIFEIPETIRITKNDTELTKILSAYHDDIIETDSYKKGKHDFPFLGFDECGLPLILHHNTPNNSLPILWNERESDFSKSEKIIGLFPRVSRHKT